MRNGVREAWRGSVGVFEGVRDVREDIGVYEWLAQGTSRMQSDWGEGESMGG